MLSDESKLFYGDNLTILRDHIPSESVDLIYLDPPFKSNQDYNVLFAEQDGSRSAAQVRAFEDTWRWDQSAAAAYDKVVESGGKVSEAMQAFRLFLGENDMLAYLSMIAPRLIELQRVMKVTGSLYLHCDPTASHYLKILMDAIFGPGNFENEISWRRTTTKGDYRQGATNWPRVRDVVLYYRKNKKTKGRFNQQFAAYSTQYVADKYRNKDGEGRAYMLDNLTAPGAGSRGHPKYEFMGVTRYWRYNKDKMESLFAEGRVVQPSPGAVPRYKRYLDEMPGVAIGDSWDDIPPINSQAQERLGYPTQKPEALLERIIRASSNEADVVLDPFCGCGTAIAAAQRLNRRWIGIDVTHLAIGLIKHRLLSAFELIEGKHYKVIGEPEDILGAMKLAEEDPYQFQSWALGKIGARQGGQIKKGADHGIDGQLYFHDERGGKTRRIIFSVKSGNLKMDYVRALRGVIEREKAEIGVLISMKPFSGPMRAEAAKAGFYHSPWGTNHPHLQLLTIDEILNGKKVDYPPSRGNITFKKAPKVMETTATPKLPFT